MQKARLHERRKHNLRGLPIVLVVWQRHADDLEINERLSRFADFILGGQFLPDEFLLASEHSARHVVHFQRPRQTQH